MLTLRMAVALAVASVGATGASGSASNGASAPKAPVDYVNPYVGTTNFGTTNPGAATPNGMMTVVPFNVMGSPDNHYDKDSRWWSTPYDHTNTFLTGLAHGSLSGVGCPELGSLLLMATTGPLEVDYHNYGTAYSSEEAHPGYYSVTLDRYDIQSESTATPRVGVTRFTFPEGRQANILLNLGEGLTNESGSWMRRISDTEVEGMKLLGSFCYNPQAVFPVYFVMRVNRTPTSTGYWKLQRPMKGVEAEWDPDQGKYKIYRKYGRDIAGDDIGVWFTYDSLSQSSPASSVEVELAISYVSTANARENLQTEVGDRTFAQIAQEARQRWNDDLGRIQVEGGTEDQKSVFYTALYHALIHPNILNDVNGQFPMMESDSLGTVAPGTNRYTVFSLWDTYRNLHQLMTLVYPDRQTQMVQSMLDMYREHGWLPKWELYGRETLTMEGDPSIPVIVDTWAKGLRDFDVQLAYQAMLKGAETPGSQNLLRPDNDDYLTNGFVPLTSQFDNSVSHALEYYIADHALAALADSLGRTDEAQRLRQRSLGYRQYLDPETGFMRPITPDGNFLKDFNPRQGENFEPSPGFHEGNSYNYTFYVPHDIPGLAQLMGGEKAFLDRLQSVFDNGYYDPANEPDIAYPYLFSKFPGQAERTQDLVRDLLARHFTTAPDGIPGNDDTGTMSAWAIFSMMGLYPDIPGDPGYTLTTPTFDRVTIQLDPAYYDGATQMVIDTQGSGDHIRSASLGDGTPVANYRVNHSDLIRTGGLKIKRKK